MKGTDIPGLFLLGHRKVGAAMVASWGNSGTQPARVWVN